MIFLKTFVISGWCLAVFIGAGYYYINSQITPVKNETESVPYYEYKPESTGVLMKFGIRTVYTYLDFESGKTVVMINPESVEEKGYSIDYELNAEYTLVADIVDYFEGINIDLNGETLRYTGLQTVELLSNENSDELREKIIKAIFSKTAEQGVGTDFFNNIIEQSKTDLKLIDCYFWAEQMDDVAKNLNFLYSK